MIIRNKFLEISIKIWIHLLLTSSFEVDKIHKVSVKIKLEVVSIPDCMIKHLCVR